MSVYMFNWWVFLCCREEVARAAKEEAEAYERHKREVREQWRIENIMAEREARGFSLYNHVLRFIWIHVKFPTYSHKRTHLAFFLGSFSSRATSIRAENKKERSI